MDYSVLKRFSNQELIEELKSRQTTNVDLGDLRELFHSNYDGSALMFLSKRDLADQLRRKGFKPSASNCRKLCKYLETLHEETERACIISAIQACGNDLDVSRYQLRQVTRIQEGASSEDIEEGSAYETVYIIYNQEGEPVMETKDWETACNYVSRS